MKNIIKDIKMINQIISSVKYVFTDRIKSPMYGAWFFSWFTINWRIWFYTFFVSHDDEKINKVDYIWNNYINIWSTFVLPFVSTVIIILFLPWLSNIVLKITLNYKKKAKEIKDKIEENILLTIEESNSIREFAAKQGIELRKILKEKDMEIEEYKRQINMLEEEKDELFKDSEYNINENFDYDLKSIPEEYFMSDSNVQYNLKSIPIEDRDDFKILLKEKDLRKEFVATYNALTNGSGILNVNSRPNLSYFHSLNIFDKNSITNGYDVTDKAKRFYKLIMDRERS